MAEIESVVSTPVSTPFTVRVDQFSADPPEFQKNPLINSQDGIIDIPYEQLPLDGLAVTNYDQPTAQQIPTELPSISDLQNAEVNIEGPQFDRFKIGEKIEGKNEADPKDIQRQISEERAKVNREKIDAAKTQLESAVRSKIKDQSVDINKVRYGTADYTQSFEAKVLIGLAKVMKRTPEQIKAWQDTKQAEWNDKACIRHKAELARVALETEKAIGKKKRKAEQNLQKRAQELNGVTEEVIDEQIKSKSGQIAVGRQASFYERGKKRRAYKAEKEVARLEKQRGKLANVNSGQKVLHDAESSIQYAQEVRSDGVGGIQLTEDELATVIAGDAVSGKKILDGLARSVANGSLTQESAKAKLEGLLARVGDTTIAARTAHRLKEHDSQISRKFFEDLTTLPDKLDEVRSSNRSELQRHADNARNIAMLFGGAAVLSLTGLGGKKKNET